MYQRMLTCFAMVPTLILLLTVNTAMTALITDYHSERTRILKDEQSQFIGDSAVLTDKEKVVDLFLLTIKRTELFIGYKNVTQFAPSRHFFDAKVSIENSEVFRFVRGVPKGASLHSHMLAGVSVDFVINNFTYRDNLYAGTVNGFFKLKFFEKGTQGSSWTLVSDCRKNITDYDGVLRRELSLIVEDHKEAYPTVLDVWTKFKRTFTAIYDLVSYRPVFEEYIYELLSELYQDNIIYTELKGTYMPLYELNGTIYNTKQFFEIFINTVEDFKKGHPGFLGVRYIHSIYRGVDNDVLRDGLNTLIELKKEFPDFIAGFDFVGYEEEGKTLYEYKDELLNASKHGLKFFFHAGETNWYGHNDLNLIDAILLNSTRIGHGFALAKHPKLLELGKQRNIPIELCPISNQVLMLNEDPRNHPAATLMALNYPVVIGNDDPAAWGAKGLSYDWYIAFMAMTPAQIGIKFLKQMALNSIEFSSMELSEKIYARDIWSKQWTEFIDKICLDQYSVNLEIK